MNSQTIWITGASTGIGRATTFEASRRGYRVVATARSVQKLNQLLADRPIDCRGEIILASADVTDHAQLTNVYRSICERFGKVDILLANAGTHQRQESDKFELQMFRELFELNLFGVLNCIDVVLPAMLSRGMGHIVGVSSVAGYRALPTAAAYGGSKSALTYILESLRFDLEPRGISVTVVSPGFVKTPLTDRNNFPMPFLVDADVAAREIMDGIMGKALEIHFPKRFTYLMKLLRLLPAGMYSKLISRMTKR